MGLRIGIIGLPNVGKSTVFNSLTGAQNAMVANYPFATIQPNRAIVPVPDKRVKKIAELVNVPDTIHATVEFVDIAGLVKGASHGEGLGNQFLGNIRDVDAILHIVRCFDDPNVVHISENPEPRTDIEIINLELTLADLQQLERKIERLNSEVKGDRRLMAMLELSLDLQGHLGEGKPVSSYPHQESDGFQDLVHEMRFLTSKSVIYVANVDEGGLVTENEYIQTLRQVAAEQDMTPEEQREFLLLAGVEVSGLGQVIHKSFDILGLISFFTKNENEVRAWEVARGTTAPKAAGRIHTDFERGFIRAEVVPYDTFVELGSDVAVKAAGKMRLEGKEYVVQDGDVIYFRFNI
jgi:ribosome-binding ATPase YchF (GTP1/OBG family)